MLWKNNKMLLCSNRTSSYYKIIRRISKYIHKDISSKTIRNMFLDYFLKEKQHVFVKSSPVIPFCDPSVPFVNAGMNQFKGIFLGTQTPHFTNVANTQKCIRVGGKHNDLSVVGQDGYHHTFFEMMGNWSFGDYFKAEACQMAWELLTKIYKIPPSQLYVTYFGGDEKLGVSCDVETLEIWKKIGVREDRLLPFSSKDNFWEMGTSGPCGPCTEIHFDHNGSVNRSQFVNKNLHDLTEIWNIVFIEYIRDTDNLIKRLPKKHIDTGMGLERLCCALQGKISSYDTDLFDYLIEAIHKNCSNVPKYSGNFGEQDWNNIDTSYRVLADHIRMITASLADGVIPEQNHKLRRILRKCFTLGESVFKKEKGLVRELSNYVVENLGDVYPEMERNISQIHHIIDYEEEIFKLLRKSCIKEWELLALENNKLRDVDLLDITPSFITAYKEVSKSQRTEVDADLAFKLYDTYGLDAEDIEQLCNVLQMQFDVQSFHKKLEEVRLKSKDSRQYSLNNVYNILSSTDIDKTDDSEKYSYTKKKTEYIFPEVQVEVLKIIDDDDNLVSEVTKDKYCSILFDKTNLYSRAGGQESDKGIVNFHDAVFQVESVENVNNYIIHRGFVHSGTVRIGSQGVISVDKDVRLQNMQNHTCTHLLNATIKNMKKSTCQKSSKVTNMYLNLDVAIFGPKLTNEDLKNIEESIKNVIKNNVDVKVILTNSQGLYSFDQITLIPGEIYPEENIRIIEIDNNRDFVSREPCCGTHVLNTGDIKDFCIVNVKSLGRSTLSLHAVTDKRAKLAKKNAEELLEDISAFRKSLGEHLDKPEILNMGFLSLKERLKYDVTSNAILPFLCKENAIEELIEVGKLIKDADKNKLRNFIDMEMQEALTSNVDVTKSDKKFMVHYLRSSMMLESAPLQRATKKCSNMPVIIIGYSDGIVNARCCVPKAFQSTEFNAEKWLAETVAKVFQSIVTAPKGQDTASVCNMKAKKVHVEKWHNLLAESIDHAKKYINEKL